MFTGIYTSPSQIKYDREMYWNWLCGLEQKSPTSIYSALKGCPPVRSSYHCMDDRQLNELYGRLLVKATENWKIPQIDPCPSGKRIGIVSGNIGATSAAAWMLTIMDLLPDCEWYIYQIGNRIADWVTEQFIAKAQGRFGMFCKRPQDAAQKIAMDGCNVLFFPDYGTNPAVNFIATQRLAPIQVASWGQPVTTGLRTIDYYLSGDLYEPKNGQKHYTETLIRLPGVGLPVPNIPRVPANRRHWEFEDHIVYLMVQNPLKYQPQHDYLYRQICEKTYKRHKKQPLFVFAKYPLVRELNGRMLYRKSSKKPQPLPGRIYNQMPRRHFWQMIASADVFLDPPGWSGANTTAEAIAQGTPVITTEGAFMRGRVSHGMLQACGLPGTVKLDDYVEAALDAVGRRETGQLIPYNARAVAKSLRKVLKLSGSPQLPQLESQAVLA